LPGLLASEPEADLFARLRAAESIGRPLGSNRFLAAIERRFVVSLGIGNLVRELDSQAKGAVLGARRKRAKSQRLEEKRSGSA